jgi:hypothetical protein
LADIVLFIPRHELTAQENLDEFIRLCREEFTVFGADLDWHENNWRVARVIFGNLDKGRHCLTASTTLKQPFLDFAKAYVRYQKGHNSSALGATIEALKCLERALLDCHGAADLQYATPGVFDRAAVLARSHYAADPAYLTGLKLRILATYVSENHLIPSALQWQNPIPKPATYARTGVKARERREKKLPSNDVLNALADIFAANPPLDRDIVTTSTAAMLLCAPSRIAEVQALQADCEISQTKRDGTLAYGWRFQPGKGAPPMIKWIPDSMTSIAKEAINRVRTITAEARRCSAWLEDNPDLFYRHSACPDVPENEPLSAQQSAMALGIPYHDMHGTRGQLRAHGLSSRDGGNSLATLNRWVHKQLPKSFPWFDKERNLRFSEALFCLNRYQLDAGRTTSPGVVWKPTPSMFNRDLCTYTIKGTTSPSIFQRHKREGAGGSPLRANSHQFRHYLNTLAQRGGLGQAEIARWSGRKDAKQNRAYDQMSEFELADMLRSHDSTLTLDRPLAEIAEQITTLIPMTRQEFNTLAIPTAHVTEFGFCIHDYVMSTCQRYRDCINCTEQVCIKGDKRLDRMRVRYSQIKQLKQRAEEAIAEGSAGADRWYEIQALTEVRLAALIAILEDPSIEDGTIVRLNNENEFSPLRRALEAKTGSKQNAGMTSKLTHKKALKGKSNGKAS